MIGCNSSRACPKLQKGKYCTILIAIDPCKDFLTPYSGIPHEKPKVADLVQRFSAFYRTHEFINVYTTACH
jgi:hypothetical protein